MKDFRMGEALVSAVAFFTGALTAFFAIGPALFADGTGQDRIVAVAIISGVYLLIGAVFGAASPAVWRSTFILFAFPSAPIVLMFCDSAALLCAAVIASVTVASGLGAWSGSRLRGRTGARSA